MSINTHPIRMAKIRSSDNVNVGKFVQKLNHPYNTGESENGKPTLENNMMVSYKTIYVLTA